jgi:hypothetical protein
MKTPNCCKHPDARACLLARHPEIRPYSDVYAPRDDLPEVFEDEVCECACHREDEDGNTEWD